MPGRPAFSARAPMPGCVEISSKASITSAEKTFGASPRFLRQHSCALRMWRAAALVEMTRNRGALSSGAELANQFLDVDHFAALDLADGKQQLRLLLGSEGEDLVAFPATTVP